MGRRQLLAWGIALGLVTIGGIAFADRWLATFVHVRMAGANTVVGPVIDGVELVFGFAISKWLTGMVLLMVAGVLFFRRASRGVAWILLFIAVSQLTTRLVAGVLKNVFMRPRPFEALARTEWRDAFFTDGSSFPSGHAAHFWPLFFAVALVFPRYRWPFLILSVGVSLSRVVVNDHYLSDVTASAALAALIVFGYSFAFRSRVRPAIG